jgi:hypothetical protein
MAATRHQVNAEPHMPLCRRGGRHGDAANRILPVRHRRLLTSARLRAPAHGCERDSAYRQGGGGRYCWCTGSGK